MERSAYAPGRLRFWNQFNLLRVAKLGHPKFELLEEALVTLLGRTHGIHAMFQFVGTSLGTACLEWMMGLPITHGLDMDKPADRIFVSHVRADFDARRKQRRNAAVLDGLRELGNFTILPAVPEEEEGDEHVPVKLTTYHPFSVTNKLLKQACGGSGDLVLEINRLDDNGFGRTVVETLDTMMAYFYHRRLVLLPPLVGSPHIGAVMDLAYDGHTIYRLIERGNITLQQLLLANDAAMTDARCIATVCAVAHTMEACARLAGCVPVTGNTSVNWTIRPPSTGAFLERHWAYVPPATLDGDTFIFVVNKEAHQHAFLTRHMVVGTIATDRDSADRDDDDIAFLAESHLPMAAMEIFMYDMLASPTYTAKMHTPFGAFVSDVMQSITDLHLVEKRYSLHRVFEAAARAMPDMFMFKTMDTAFVNWPAAVPAPILVGQLAMAESTRKRERPVDVVGDVDSLMHAFKHMRVTEDKAVPMYEELKRKRKRGAHDDEDEYERETKRAATEPMEPMSEAELKLQELRRRFYATSPYEPAPDRREKRSRQARAAEEEEEQKEEEEEGEEEATRAAKRGRRDGAPRIDAMARLANYVAGTTAVLPTCVACGALATAVCPETRAPYCHPLCAAIDKGHLIVS